jgi:hypothetical protein
MTCFSNWYRINAMLRITSQIGAKTMERYTVKVTDASIYMLEIEAETEKEAEQKALEQYYKTGPWVYDSITVEVS